MNIQRKRVYDEADPGDGWRVLVDRLWPRGVSKERARLDRWAKELAPSPTLRAWFNHNPAKFGEFRQRYETELAENSAAARELIGACPEPTMTLLYAAADREFNHAVVLQEFLSTVHV